MTKRNVNLFRDDFFKSTEIQSNGHLLQKSIPTTAGKTVEKVIKTKEKKTSPEVTKFVKKIEDTFKVIDGVVKDLMAMYPGKPERCGEMLEAYNKFKNQFSWKVNDAINYPKDGEIVERPKSDYEKSRIKI
jgi:hypothetical protein